MYIKQIFAGIVVTSLVAGCGGSIGSGGFGRALERSDASDVEINPNERTRSSTIWDLFDNSDDPNVTVKVNKYIWNASLDILNFMPVQAADPFTGVLVMGFGTPPGGGRAYRATVYVQDPALDARSLVVSLQTRAGPADPDTVRAIEDAILTRARQLRLRDQAL